MTTSDRDVCRVGEWRSGVAYACNPQVSNASMRRMLFFFFFNDTATTEIYTGPWTDVGTPERLAQLNAI